MADQKISALTSASTPLAGTEVLPIVQSGATVKVAVSNLTAGRAISATQLTLSTGNVIQGTAATGFNFTANTPLAGMTSQLLNWYEEGLTGTLGLVPETSGTITLFTGYTTMRYTRIGRLVTLTGELYMTTVSSPVGTYVTLTGLPFTVPNIAQSQGGALYAQGGSIVAGTYGITASPGTTTAVIKIPAANFGPGSDLTITLSYTI